MTSPNDVRADWAKGLLNEQMAAASHTGGNARLLAGPGTGKTYTLKARVEYLVLEKQIEPESVTALTFTRAAAGELRRRVDDTLAGKVVGRPFIMTLHAFALQTLLRNSDRIDALPRPLRIADDWEERNIVQEDLRVLTNAAAITIVQENLQAVAADWDTLRADDTQPNPLKADAGFLGAWQQHRLLYGYTLRSELVYQLKRALEQRNDFTLHSKELKHLLVDEYQDLNACDLMIVKSLAAIGAEIYAAGDDDQSIYGFRHANPEGIRRFDKEHAPSTDLSLAVCMRCDNAIMELARFVANLDPRRLQKPWKARDGAGAGEVQLLAFDNGGAEASGIASLCRYLIDEEKYKPDDILILIRSDSRGAFSKPLAEQMQAAGVQFNLNVGAPSPLDSSAGRVLLSMIRLAVDDMDSLAWRTLLQVRKNGIGSKAIGEIVAQAEQTGETFAQALKKVATSSTTKALRTEFATLSGILSAVKAVVGPPQQVITSDQLSEKLVLVNQALIAAGVDGTGEALAHIATLAKQTDADSINSLLGALATTGFAEQELAAGAVNMLTMHKAKGLSARAVIIMACEDEYIPGRQQAVNQEADERRLLYVSLTRAKQRLFITYAQARYGQQQHTGRDSGKNRRGLTRYLRNAPVHPTRAAEYFEKLGKD